MYMRYDELDVLDGGNHALITPSRHAIGDVGMFFVPIGSHMA